MTQEELKDLKPGDKISILFDVDPWDDYVKKEIQHYFNVSGKDHLVVKGIASYVRDYVLVEEDSWVISCCHVRLIPSKGWSYKRDY